MLIDDDGFELGMPSHEEMAAHQVLLLRHESEQAWQQLAKAREDMQKLVDINWALNQQVIALRQDLKVARAQACMEANLHRQGGFSTWGGHAPDQNRPPPAIYPVL
ncbi:hypothetical protein CXG50_05000 [Pseudomonas plecoglossicida]|uniref:hypothetical protein n=1 Tax=Pseudomonas TaxID=286 RepID=UPI0002A16282|nr:MULTISPECIES: hypothetical protein [Pseudomonas]AGA74235.1 hypothetical protein B479_16715 [Pseudomonas putida HB3267]MCE0942008.1 hypothetical protein [Pseudomonas asiatica]MCE0953108.1 hypothetical protein [Pseudomonas asiatica]MCE1062441.1 hypothetical protein [Pseudomonas asiatica]MCE1097762.1 hypothetical protein [Pseudomonas asiatica]